jgi:1,2-diacylglycerol 3-alpha-glucosyltransferase
MNLVIVTNTFTPHLGGVARSVESFTEAYRRRGHRVLVVAPEFPGTPKGEVDVIRVPAIQNFNASDFSVALPVPAGLTAAVERFKPDVVHSQHPFLLGMTAVRIARSLQRPLVFTHHTLYEQYTHYVPGDSPLLKRFVVELATRYANLSDQVFAPSQSVRDLLSDRGVAVPIRVVPTGVELERFSQGDGTQVRRRYGIPEEAFVVGHLGRLAPEKNLEFLARSVARFMVPRPWTWLLVVGEGPSSAAIHQIFSEAGIEDRLVTCGPLQNEQLANALHAMNLFAFASKSETQGMVLIEAMAAGLPVVALDAPGAREAVKDRHNGRLLHEGSIEAFSDALSWLLDLPAEQLREQMTGARRAAQAFSLPRCADSALECFASLARRTPHLDREEEKGWEQVMTRIKAEWEILRSLTRAGDDALSHRLSGQKEAR